MKKIIALLLSVAMIATVFTGCQGAQDWEYIEQKGNLVIGITYYEPMNYLDENGELVGFETEFAKAVCDVLGVEPVFQEINWDNKELELKSKSIDCIWNGLTVTEERKENMAFSTPYVENKQVVIIQKANADKYTDMASLNGIKIAAENGSAGEEAIVADETLSQDEYVGVAAQSDAVLEVKAGTVDACVIDYVMAKAIIKDDTDYSDLMIIDGIELAIEEYAIGLRLEDKETLAKINDAILTVSANGTLDALAEKYGVNVKIN